MFNARENYRAYRNVDITIRKKIDPKDGYFKTLYPLFLKGMY